MKRREFLLLLYATSLSSSVNAAANGRPRVIWLGAGVEMKARAFVAAFKQGMEELGYVDNKNFEFLARFAENDLTRMPALVEEVIRLEPAVIVAGAADVAGPVKKATSTIPIVTAALSDPIRLGLIEAIAHPGSNVTGIMPFISGLPSKQIEVAREVVPSVAKIGLLGNSKDPAVPPQLAEMVSRAHELGIETVAPEVRGPQDVAGAITALANGRVDAVIVLESTMLLSLRQQIAQMMIAARLPSIYGFRLHVAEGGLISYGVDLRWCWYHLATFVDRILRGASPADLPVEFPTKLELVINLTTAKALGLTLQPTLIARADDVID
ncbi:MAG TPA: ABC transporter substrate-binding protein [Bradyrhizobium sp.]|uniref:ABC transporter substrate-binding protein n=1 Tax=Bradyrhizobium sp. TaxID=376 RepID=UPI002B844799|nr:ABC transporter substrate-binding protein [Bradyrhizobium sp.]HLZ06938.1 ABC transporter substrate-binding protein [Bradyrhizobium sp.]